MDLDLLSHITLFERKSRRLTTLFACAIDEKHTHTLAPTTHTTHTMDQKAKKYVEASAKNAQKEVTAFVQVSVCCFHSSFVRVCVCTLYVVCSVCMYVAWGVRLA
jgi:hypothetical protein